MADSAVAVTAGSGTNIDTRTESTNSNHRQVVVLGDPADNTGVAPVDGTAGIKVDLGTDNDVVAAGSVAEDSAAADNPVQMGLEYSATLPSVDSGDVVGWRGSAGGVAYVHILDSSDAIVDPATAAEDTAHTTADSLMPVAAVRRDAKAVGSGTDGDYSTLNVNDLGDLRVDGGSVLYADVTLTPTTSATEAGDVLADTQIVSACVRANDAQAVLHSITLIDEADQGEAIDLVFMRTSTSIGTENAAISISAANLGAGLIGTVSIAAADYDDYINAQAATLTNVGLAIDPVSGSDDIYVGAVCRSGTPTYTASSLKLRLGFIVD